MNKVNADWKNNETDTGQPYVFHLHAENDFSRLYES